jgi:hypothetical protein
MAWSSGGVMARVGHCPWPPPDDCAGFLCLPRRSTKDNSSRLCVSLSYVLTMSKCVDEVCATPLSCRTTKCWSTQWGLACRQARKPRDKNHVSPLWLILWISPSDWYSYYHDWFIPRHGGIKFTFLSFIFPQTSCNKLFSIISLESLFYLC